MKKASVILIDWSVRESFHAIDYLNKQTIPRSNYEIIWVEYYNHRPKPIKDYFERGNIDKWIVLKRRGMYFKHLMYNEGIVAATGEIIVIPDSDAIFSSTFIESIVTTFNNNENIVLYLEEVRSGNREFYPFRHVSWKTIMETPGLINWDCVAKKPCGLTTEYDKIHYRNYGACFCATRKSIIEVGGCDEHELYHSFLCGPYEVGWRMVNKGYREIWHQSEWLLHVWHPWVRSGVGIMGESDGAGINSTALEIRKTKKVFPLVENEKIRILRMGGGVVSTKSQPEKSNIAPHKLMESKSTRFENNLHKFKCIMKSLLQIPVKINRALIIMENDYEGLFYRTIKFTGEFTSFISNPQVFNYARLYLKFGQQEMSERLIKKCKRFKPDLVIFIPLKDSAEQSLADTVEPTKDAINRIVNELGIKVYVHNLNSTKRARYDKWFPLVNYVGIIDSLSECDKYADNPKVIRGYPAVNSIHFYDKDMERDIDVSFWGSVPVNSKREKYINFLRDNGINVYTREHRVSVEKYAEILNRSKISLSFCQDGEGEGQLRRRTFEIMACKSLLLEDGVSETKRLFGVGKDFIIFRNKEELLEKVKYYLQHEEERKSIAQSGYDKVTNVYNARKMWEGIFENMGFDNKKGGVYSKIAYFCSGFFRWIVEEMIKKTIRKRLPLGFLRLMISIISRLRLRNRFLVRFQDYIYSIR